MSIGAVTPRPLPGVDVLDKPSVVPAGAQPNVYEKKVAALKISSNAELLASVGLTDTSAPQGAPIAAPTPLAAPTPTPVDNPNLTIDSTGKKYVPVTSTIDPAPLQVDLFSESTIAAQNAIYHYALAGKGSILDYQS